MVSGYVGVAWHHWVVGQAGLAVVCLYCADMLRQHAAGTDAGGLLWSL